MSNKQPQDESDLLRRFARAAGRVTDACPSELELAAYADGLGDEAGRARIEAHLADCPSCLDAVVLARELASAAVPEARAAVAARARALVPARRALGRMRRWRRVAGWVAAAAAAAAMGFAGLRAGAATRERGQTGTWVANELTFQPPAACRGLLASQDVLGDLVAQAREGGHEQFLRILLLVSLSFNVMFAVGYFCTPTAGQAPESPEQAANAVAQTLGLDPQQRETFLSLRQEARQQSEALAQTASLLQDELCSKTASPAADPEAVAELEDDLADVRDVHQQIQLDQFRRFMDVLTPVQREAAAKMIHSRSAERRLHRQRILQEFDTDGDGKLSPAERAKAIQALRERHGGRHEGKARHRAPERPGTYPPANSGK